MFDKVSAVVITNIWPYSTNSPPNELWTWSTKRNLPFPKISLTSTIPDDSSSCVKKPDPPAMNLSASCSAIIVNESDAIVYFQILALYDWFPGSSWINTWPYLSTVKLSIIFGPSVPFNTAVTVPPNSGFSTFWKRKRYILEGAVKPLVVTK